MTTMTTMTTWTRPNCSSIELNDEKSTIEKAKELGWTQVNPKEQGNPKEKRKPLAKPKETE